MIFLYRGKHATVFDTSWQKHGKICPNSSFSIPLLLGTFAKMGRGRLALRSRTAETAPRINQQKRTQRNAARQTTVASHWIKRRWCAFTEAISFPLAARATGSSSSDLVIDLQATRNPRVRRGGFLEVQIIPCVTREPYRFFSLSHPTLTLARLRFIERGSAFNQSTSRYHVAGVKNWLALHSILAATCPPTCPPSSLEDRCASRTNGHQARPLPTFPVGTQPPMCFTRLWKESGPGAYRCASTRSRGRQTHRPRTSNRSVAHLPTNQSFYESPLAVSALVSRLDGQ
jgi:hypothetical protein